MIKQPYFHQENGITELRVPLNPKQERNLKAILEFFPADANKIATRQIGTRDWLSGLSDPERREIVSYCAHQTLQEKYDVLAHFHKLGWVGDLSLERAKKELDGQNASKPQQPDERRKLEDKMVSHWKKAARLVLQGGL